MKITHVKNFSQPMVTTSPRKFDNFHAIFKKEVKLHDYISLSFGGYLAQDDELNNQLLKVGANVEEVVANAQENYINGGYSTEIYDLKDRNGDPIGYVLAIPRKNSNTQILQPIHNKRFESCEDQWKGINVGQRIAQFGDYGIHKKTDMDFGALYLNEQFPKKPKDFSSAQYYNLYYLFSIAGMSTNDVDSLISLSKKDDKTFYKEVEKMFS